MRRSNRVNQWLAHAFAVAQGSPFEPEDEALAERLATFLVNRRMTAPALLALEVGRPVTFLGSQLMAFLKPFLTLVFSAEESTRFVGVLERRDGVDLLVDALTRLENKRHG